MRTYLSQLKNDSLLKNQYQAQDDLLTLLKQGFFQQDNQTCHVGYRASVFHPFLLTLPKPVWYYFSSSLANKRSNHF